MNPDRGSLLNRRTFLDRLLHGTFAVTLLTGLGTVIAYLYPTKRAGAGTEEVEVGAETNIPVGEGKVVKFHDRQALVIHTKEGFTALSAICTHLGCIVKWDAQKQQIHCPCHAAVFDLNGNVLSGPPKEPLPKVAVRVSEGTIYLGGA